jgi:hypothetical protein
LQKNGKQILLFANLAMQQPPSNRALILSVTQCAVHGNAYRKGGGHSSCHAAASNLLKEHGISHE